MALHHDRDFIEIAEEADARRAIRWIWSIGILVLMLLGFGLVSLLMYGRILTNPGVVELTAPPVVTVPRATVPPSAPKP